MKFEVLCEFTRHDGENKIKVSFDIEPVSLQEMEDATEYLNLFIRKFIEI